MTNSMITGLVAILRHYVADDGKTLTQEAGPTAAQRASELWLAASDTLRQETTGAVIVDAFVANPDVYREPVAHQLAKATAANAELAARLEALLRQYETAVQHHAGTATPTYQATLEGSGAIAQGTGATAVGKRGVHLSGSRVGGSIVTGKVKAGRDFVGRDKIEAFPHGDEATKAELARLLAALEEALAQAPAEKEEEAEAVLVAAQDLLEKAAADKPNKTSIQISGEGLKQAAENLAAVTPTVLTIAGQIVAAISRFT